MLKKLSVYAITLAALTLSATCFAEITGKEAVEIARKEVPANAVMYGVKRDENKITVYFRDNEGFRDYDVDVDTNTGKLLEMEIKGSNNVGSTMVLKTEEEVRAVVLAKYPDAQNLVIKTEKEGVNTKYVAKFSTKKFKEAELEISPVTLAIGEEELEYR